MYIHIPALYTIINVRYTLNTSIRLVWKFFFRYVPNSSYCPSMKKKGPIPSPVWWYVKTLNTDNWWKSHIHTQKASCKYFSELIWQSVEFIYFWKIHILHWKIQKICLLKFFCFFLFFFDKIRKIHLKKNRCANHVQNQLLAIT